MKGLGVTSDHVLITGQHINSVYRACYHQIGQIIYISVLDVKSAKHWYHVLILDYCDARLNGLSLKILTSCKEKFKSVLFVWC